MALDAVPVRGVSRPVPLAEAIALSLACETLKAIPGGELVADALLEEASRSREAFARQADRSLWWCEGFADGAKAHDSLDYCRAYDALEKLADLLGRGQ